MVHSLGAEQEGILEGGGTVFLFDGLQIAHIIGELCADIWKAPHHYGNLQAII